MTAPAGLCFWIMVSWTSPVPGGRSTISSSVSPQCGIDQLAERIARHRPAPGDRLARLDQLAHRQHRHAEAASAPGSASVPRPRAACPRSPSAAAARGRRCRHRPARPCAQPRASATARLADERRLADPALAAADRDDPARLSSRRSCATRTLVDAGHRAERRLIAASSASRAAGRQPGHVEDHAGDASSDARRRGAAGGDQALPRSDRRRRRARRRGRRFGCHARALASGRPRQSGIAPVLPVDTIARWPLLFGEAATYNDRHGTRAGGRPVAACADGGRRRPLGRRRGRRRRRRWRRRLGPRNPVEPAAAPAARRRWRPRRRRSTAGSTALAIAARRAAAAAAAAACPAARTAGRSGWARGRRRSLLLWLVLHQRPPRSGRRSAASSPGSASIRARSSPGSASRCPRRSTSCSKLDVDEIRTIDIGSTGASGAEADADRRPEPRRPRLFGALEHQRSRALSCSSSPIPRTRSAKSPRARCAQQSPTSTLNDAIGPQRAEIEARVRQRMQEILDGYRAGVAVAGRRDQAGRSARGGRTTRSRTSPPRSRSAQSLHQRGARLCAAAARRRRRATRPRSTRSTPQYKLAPEVTRRRMYYETMEQRAGQDRQDDRRGAGRDALSAAARTSAERSSGRARRRPRK